MLVIRQINRFVVTCIVETKKRRGDRDPVERSYNEFKLIDLETVGLYLYGSAFFRD